ncbi:MAG TPA: AAA family ATPase [Polyangiaceae bacterium]|nr:AAA family ATPase [Polyangiaceae bacterium]
MTSTEASRTDGDGGPTDAARMPPLEPAPRHDPLPPESLRRRCDAAALGFVTTADLRGDEPAFGQERAARAVRFAMSMRRPGYNVFALGSSGVGKHAIVRELVAEYASEQPPPSDWVYVEDFARPAEPRAIELPQGHGRLLVEDMKKLVQDLQAAIPAAFATREYATRLEELQREFQAKHDALFSAIEATGASRGIAVLRSPSGVVFAAVKEGEILSPDQLEKLPDEEKTRLRATVQELQTELSDRLKELPRIHRELRERLRELERSVTRYTVDGVMEDVVRRYAALPEVARYLSDVRLDVVEEAALFRLEKDEESPIPPPLRPDRRLVRYAVNLLVDRSECPGAPVEYDDHATYEHLVGRVEHYAEFGNLVTNFSLIKSGSLHRANGGVLLLDARDLLAQPYAWTALKRALSGGRIEIEPLSQVLGLSTSESLRPRPIPLNVKVVLFGPREIYYLLAEHDPEFASLFKVEADFEDVIERTSEAERRFASRLAAIARRSSVRPLSAEAVGRLVEEASRLADDGRKLSTNVRGLVDIVLEGEHYAAERASVSLDVEDVDRAMVARTERRDRIRRDLVEAVTRRTILIDVTGERIGQVNGLAAVSLADFTFGRPTRITATARIGEGRIVDIEREVELGGPFHSKGVLILTNYLAARYAKQYPLSLSASLVFEQSYSGVEGDSASLAELCALLSAIAEIPVKQSIAVTGSVNQSGKVQAVGAVNEKVEGFFDVCRAVGLSGSQGVIVPRANVDWLMLREDVVLAAREGRFHVVPVDTVNEAMEVLTGVRAGEPDADGDSPAGTLNQRVEQRLIDFAVVAKRFGELFELGGEEEPKDRDQSDGRSATGVAVSAARPLQASRKPCA